MVSQIVVALPAWLVAFLLVAGAGLVSVGVTLLLRRLTRRHRREYHNDVLGFLFSAAAVVYAVLLAFVVFAVWEGFSGAERIVNQEAATLVSLYLDTETFPQPLRNEAQRAIREYTFSVAGDEFPAMQSGRDSRDTERTLFDLFGVYNQLHPADAWQQQLESASLGRLDQVALLRSQRLQASQSSLPDLFWIVLVLGGVLTLVLGAPLFMEHAHLHVGSSLLLGGTMGAVLFLILAVNQPFTGAVAIRPESFERNVQTYRTIDAVVAERGASVQTAGSP
jgi:hypothetical protein